MEGYDWAFDRGRHLRFDEVPAEHRRTIYGVDYIHLRGMQSGDLFLTRWGWPQVPHLTPDRWFTGQRFSRVGRALAGATGAVYRVPVEHPRAPDFALVVKFSRFAQDSGVTRFDPGPADRPEDADRFLGAEFLSPFEEFANLVQLRNDARPPIYTKRPLAIYSPATRHLEWELARKSFIFKLGSKDLLQNQTHHSSVAPVTYDAERLYVLLYHWIDGIDATQAYRANLLSQSTVHELTDLARTRVRQAGWVVADHKPHHVIVRTDRDGKLLRRHGQILWGLVDFELLFRARNVG